MSVYYTTARNRKGNTLKIPIESKHLYANTGYESGYAFGDEFGGPTGHKMGYKAERASPLVLYLSNYMVDSGRSFGWRWERGTGPDQVIGDKIAVKSVQFHFEFSIDNDAIVAMADNDLSWANSGYNRTKQFNVIKNNDPSDDHFHFLDNKSWRRDYRMQVIHFEQDLPSDLGDIQELLAKWYDNTYVPTVYNDTSATYSTSDSEYGYTNVISNKAVMMRESTPYTGKFQIMKDFSFSLSDTKPYHIVDFSLDPKRQVNLASKTEGEGAAQKTYYYISDDWWLNTVIVLWPPLNYDMDMDPLSAYQLKSFDASTATTIHIANYRYFMKLTYYDV